MKKLTIIFGLMFIMSIFSVQALTTDITSFTLGNTNQQASNLNRDLNIYLSSTVVFLNTSDTITLDSVEPVAPFVSTNASVTNNIDTFLESQVINGDNVEVKVTARIPEGLSAVNGLGEEASFKVATLTFSDDNNGTSTVDVFMQRESKLQFQNVEFRYGDDEEDIKDGEDIDDIKPDDSGTFDIEVENIYAKSSDIEIRDVEIRIVDDNNDLDIDEEESLGTIREGEEDSETISIDVDEDVDEGKFDLFIRTTGFDEFGARHGEQYTISFDIEKEDDEISIRRLDLSPDSVDSCESKDSTVTVSVENTGSKDQDEVAITAFNSQLNFRETINDIELDEDETTTKRFFVSVPKDSPSGAYRITVQTFYKDDRRSDEKEITLYVQSCTAEIPTVSPTTGSSGNNDPVEVQLLPNAAHFNGQSAAQPVTQKSTSKNKTSTSVDEPLFTVKTLALLLLVAILVIFLVAMVLPKK